MTNELMEKWKKKINAMSYYEMDKMWRRAPDTHPVFAGKQLFKYFKNKFDTIGGSPMRVCPHICTDYGVYRCKCHGEIADMREELLKRIEMLDTYEGMIEKDKIRKVINEF